MLFDHSLQAGRFPLPGHGQARCCSPGSLFGVFAPRGMGVETHTQKKRLSTRTTSTIALSPLTLSAKNVRVVAPDQAAHRRLMASSASQGIFQNLVVVPGG